MDVSGMIGRLKTLEAQAQANGAKKLQAAVNEVASRSGEVTGSSPVVAVSSKGAVVTFSRPAPQVSLRGEYAPKPRRAVDDVVRTPDVVRRTDRPRSVPMSQQLNEFSSKVKTKYKEK